MVGQSCLSSSIRERLNESILFLDRAALVMEFFILKVVELVKQGKGVRTVFLHNLGRFDGLFILRYLLQRKNTEGWIIRPVIRNNKIYEIALLREEEDQRKEE